MWHIRLRYQNDFAGVDSSICFDCDNSDVNIKLISNGRDLISVKVSYARHDCYSTRNYLHEIRIVVIGLCLRKLHKLCNIQIGQSFFIFCILSVQIYYQIIANKACTSRFYVSNVMEMAFQWSCTIKDIKRGFHSSENWNSDEWKPSITTYINLIDCHGQ